MTEAQLQQRIRNLEEQRKQLRLALNDAINLFVNHGMRHVVPAYWRAIINGSNN